MDDDDKILKDLIDQSLSLNHSATDATGVRLSQKQYLLGLRKNRAQFVNALFCSDPDINADINTVSDPSAAHNALDARTRRDLLRKVTNIQNQTRGKLGELLGRVALTQDTELSDAEIVTDKSVFETPYGQRRVDLFVPEKGWAIETKMGYVVNSKSIRNQISKDSYLYADGQFTKIIWILIKGGSRPLLENLARHGIEIRIGWPIS